MRYTVTQTFHTAQQRFHKGQEIEDSAIEGPVSAERWVELGKLMRMDAEPAAVTVTEPAAEPVHADNHPSE
jgi:hypothetical protein